MSDIDQNRFAESIKQLRFSIDILFPLIYSEKLVVKYRNLKIESPFYKHDLYRTTNALKKRLIKTGVDQSSVDLFIKFFTGEYLKFEKSQLEAAAACPTPPRRSLYARLSPTYNVKLWIERNAREYAEQIGITQHYMPSIIFSREELCAMPVKMTVKESKKCFGMCVPESKIIFIHVKKHSAYERLKDTILRALVYYRFGDLKDDTEVEERISSIKSGRKYKVKSISTEKRPPMMIY
jgi:hypothetical protein